jgi:uncharacterized BrkB/YihY/UPF0761 family membrane protein
VSPSELRKVWLAIGGMYRFMRGLEEYYRELWEIPMVSILSFWYIGFLRSIYIKVACVYTIPQLTNIIIELRDQKA